MFDIVLINTALYIGARVAHLNNHIIRGVGETRLMVLLCRFKVLSRSSPDTCYQKYQRTAITWLTPPTF